MSAADILVVSVDSTSGWRAAARELVQAFRRAGASVESVSTGPVPQVRSFVLTDLVQARAARRATIEATAGRDFGAIVYCSITAALLWPRPGAIWLDSIAAENRPGRHGVWQRVIERRRLSQAPLVMAMSDQALAPGLVGPADVVVVPSPVHRSGRAAPAPVDRDIAALTYAGNPEKKRLGFILHTWDQARRPGETLVVAGIDGLDPIDGVEPAGRLPPDEYRALLRRAKVFVAAPQREDYGIAQLEALADGCVLVSTPAPGPYPALDLARRLDPRLVDADLGTALRAALDDPLPGYAERARELLAPFGREAVDRTIGESVLPRLVTGWQQR